MAEVKVQEAKGKKKESLGPGKPKRRAVIRIDMTPMVDVAFLLLIFFMVTTVFRQPLAMEVNMPEPGAKVEVPVSNVLVIYIDRDDALYSKLGDASPQPVGWGDLVALFRDLSRQNPNLIILAKIHPEARYERMVDMMDTLDEAHMERFSLVRMTEEDTALLTGSR